MDGETDFLSAQLKSLSDDLNDEAEKLAKLKLFEKQAPVNSGNAAICRRLKASAVVTLTRNIKIELTIGIDTLRFEVCVRQQHSLSNYSRRACGLLCRCWNNRPNHSHDGQRDSSIKRVSWRVSFLFFPFVSACLYTPLHACACLCMFLLCAYIKAALIC
jgi:hypothetical protein